MRPVMLILVIILCLSSVPLSAQEIIWGLNGGLNVADMYLKDEDGNKEPTRSEYGMMFGAQATIPVHEQVGLQLELNFIQKGVLYDQPEPEPNIIFRLNCIEVPVLARVQFSKNSPYLLGGVSVGYVMGADVDLKVNGINFSADIRDVLHRADISLVAGAGISFPVGSALVYLEGRYMHGLLDQLKGGTVVLEGAGYAIPQELDKRVEGYNRGYQILGGFRIPLSLVWESE